MRERQHAPLPRSQDRANARGVDARRARRDIAQRMLRPNEPMTASWIAAAAASTSVGFM
jgi:hypothetical protein